MKNIILQLIGRYLPLVSDGSVEHKMLLTMQKEIDNFTEDKANRWLGFIQGVMFCNGLIDIDTERDFTRPLFHAHYEKTGIKIPPTISTKD